MKFFLRKPRKIPPLPKWSEKVRNGQEWWCLSGMVRNGDDFPKWTPFCPKCTSQIRNVTLWSEINHFLIRNETDLVRNSTVLSEMVEFWSEMQPFSPKCKFLIRNASLQIRNGPKLIVSGPKLMLIIRNDWFLVRNPSILISNNSKCLNLIRNQQQNTNSASENVHKHRFFLS